MQQVSLNKKDVKLLTKEKSINNGTVYLEDGRIYKFSRDFLDDVNIRNVFTRSNYGIDPNKIEWLSSKQKDIKHSTLPCGIITCNGMAVGIIFPKYFSDYKDFTKLSREDTILFLKNIRQAILNNEELILNDIYNVDFVFPNILYSGEDVEIVNLNGKYIKNSKLSDISSVYSYFVSDLYKALDNKLKIQCKGHASEYSKSILLLREIFSNNANCSNLIDYPNILLDQVERAKILK